MVIVVVIYAIKLVVVVVNLQHNVMHVNQDIILRGRIVLYVLINV